MASLSAEARAARFESQRMRDDMRTLRFVMRGNLERSREGVNQAKAETERARARRARPLPSPWSELAWLETYETLDCTLVPLD